jgi:AAA family ATP:ADP antiporter
VGKMVETGARAETAALERTATTDADRAQIKQQQRAYVREFYSNFFGMVNLVSALLQALVVSRVIQLVGVRRGLLIMPVVVLVGWLGFLAFATVATIRITKTAENSVDYSLQNTLRQALYLPTSRESKYKAKAAIDAFVFRLADVVAAFGLVYLLANVLDLGVRAVAAVNVALVVVWLLVALWTGRLHDVRTAERAARAARGLRETAT